MPDMNENAETQQEYFGKVRTDNTKTLYNALNKITALEKENAELKKLKRECETSLCRAEYQWMYERFEKSKEIIREFMKYEINEYDGSLEIHFEELKKQAEQFLKETE